ncbi:hypothetical protein RF11_11396 [Thelohanellus kitauei]|uniref:Uncharacterized protein n=1 Tax=Thelohanellus kitauei TaxID=669202 RepID=A0A0C2JYR7_THEKT|nr:hypothetical protein RF11_11396 [Thelohanellus kitauei]
MYMPLPPFNAPTHELSESLENEANIKPPAEGIGTFFLRSPIICFGSARFVPQLYEFNEPESRFHGLIPASVDQCLKGSIDRYWHESAYYESGGGVSKYPEDKQAFKIRSVACGLIWLSIAIGVFTYSAFCHALPTSLLPGDSPSPE